MKSRRVFLSFLALIILFLVSYLITRREHADEVFVNGIVYTVDSGFHMAGAFAVRDGRIAGVGTTDEILRDFQPEKTTDLEGQTVLPGLIDAHAHITSLGISRLTVDLFGAATEEEAVRRVASRVKNLKPGQWVRGRGWNQNLWPSKSFPHRSMLDKVSPDNPVILSRIDGHAIWVNSKALEIAGVTASTPDPDGGRILKDRSGNPTGIFVDNAELLIEKYLPLRSHDELRDAWLAAQEECLSLGLTTVHDMGVDLQDLAALQEIIDEGQLRLRVYAAIGGPGETWESYRQQGPVIGGAGDRLTVRALKLYADGALGSRGAALIEQYSDEPDNRGLTVTSKDELYTLTREAIDHGFQVCVHAIGDRGNNIALNVYEKALEDAGEGDYRLRVEHAQVLDEADIPRFKALSVIPSMQPTHCTSDMYWAEARLGPLRVKGAYAWRSLLKSGVYIPGGSDFPVENPDPIKGIYAALTRQDVDGHPRNADDVRDHFQLSAAGLVDDSDFDGGWYASQRMTFEEAIRSFTIWAARAAFEEEKKGSIEAGKLADFIILSSSIDPSNPASWLETSVVSTYSGGERVFHSQR